jgi:hypothetical protein
VIRSGGAALAFLAISVGLGALGLLSAVLQMWLVAASLGAAWIATGVVGTALLLCASPEELERRALESERSLEGWARGMATLSGAWNPSVPAPRAGPPR